MEANPPRKKIITPLAALEKAKRFCAYQERCQQEMRDRLYEWKQEPETVEAIIAGLISDDFLNEERFAKAYARGKFRIKSWGRIKIKLSLKQKKISDYCINKGLQEIEETEYFITLNKLAEKQFVKITDKNPLLKKQKLTRLLLSKGYEQDIVYDTVEKVIANSKHP